LESFDGKPTGNLGFTMQRCFPGSNWTIMGISPEMTTAAALYSDLPTKLVDVIWMWSPRREYLPPTMRIM